MGERDRLRNVAERRSPRLVLVALVALTTVASAAPTTDPTAGRRLPRRSTDHGRIVVQRARRLDHHRGRAAPRGRWVGSRQVAEIDEPTAMAFSPDGKLAFVTQRTGRVWALAVDGDDFTVLDEPALDLTRRVESGDVEQGLLGVAVAPDGASIVVDFIERGGTDGTSVIEHYALDGDRVDAASRTEVLRVDQPFKNHNGGQVVFGPDGMLYIGFGDGGGQGDPSGNGQNHAVLLAKILRLDVSGGVVRSRPTTPSSAPPQGRGPRSGCTGVRNPWRFSFDRANGDLWIGDVGGSEREEVDHLPATAGVGAGKGANLGWEAREGTASGTDDPAGPELVDPVFEYSHDDGCSITGGFVYRGASLPGLVGDYVFGDYCTGTLWALDATSQVRSLQAQTDQLSSFAEAPDGELYALSLDGAVLRDRRQA